MRRAENIPARAAGVTLVELMVAITVLVVMMAGVGLVFSESSKAVRLTRGAIEANANCRAGLDLLREDLQAMTPDGFLCIAGEAGGNRPVLMFAATGRFVSQTNPPVEANAALIAYMPVDDAQGGAPILSRCVYLLTGNGAAAHATLAAKAGAGALHDDDLLSVSLGDVQTAIRTDIIAFARDYIQPLRTGPAELDTAPLTIGGVERLWPYVFGGCEAVEFDYVDGKDDAGADVLSPNNPTRWIGLSSDLEGDDDPAAARTNRNAIDGVASESGLSIARPVLMWDYRAAADAWPRAIRLRLTVGGASGREVKAREYSAVVRLPR